MNISLCITVKNEEDWIKSAVGSVRSIISEVIIADTGSTDSTPQHLEAAPKQNRMQKGNVNAIRC